jgi:hypothetical protein
MHAKLALVTLLLFTAPAYGRDLKNFVNASAPRGAIKRVIVDIRSGSISIRNSATNQIVVSGTIERDFDDYNRRDDEQRILDDIRVEITREGNDAIIGSRFGSQARGWKTRNLTAFDLDIEIPAGVHVQVDTRFGEVEIDGTFGDIDVNLRAGEIDIRTPRVNVRELSASCRVGEVRTDLGNRVVKREGVFPGRTEYFNEAGKTYVRAHVTAGEVDVVLTR